MILTGPFAAFAAYERRKGLPAGLLRRINTAYPDNNAWARLERSEIELERFRELFEAEAKALGHRVDAREALELVDGDVRPEMAPALRAVSARYKTARPTNNFHGAGPRSPAVAEVMGLFDAVFESRELGSRIQRFYALACERLGCRSRGRCSSTTSVST